MDDKVLRQNIIDALDFDPSVDAAAIDVGVEKGTVTLRGHVGSYAAKLAVEATVRRVKGVRNLNVELEVRLSEDQKTADDRLAQRVSNILAWHSMVPDGAVKVTVRHGLVILEGTVDWQFQRQSAEEAICRLTGINSVSNRIGVKPCAPPADVKDSILAALRRDATFETDAIRVHVIGNKVVLEGEVNAWNARQAAEHAAWSIPGVAAVEDNISLA